MIELLLAVSAFAAPQPPLAWEDAMARARQNNSSLKSSESSLSASEAERRQAYGAFLPSVTASARRSGSRSERNDVQLSKTRSDSLSLTASLNVFNGFATVGAVKKAGYARDISALDALLQSVTVRYELRQAFFNLAVQQERIRLFEKTVTRQQQNEKLVGLKYESGAEARWNVNKTRADLERARYNLESAKAELSLAQQELARVIEQEDPASLSVASGFQLPPAPELKLDAMLPVHPRAERARLQEESSGADRIIARAGFLPSVDLSYSRSREPLENKPFTHTNTWSLTASWNLFSGLSDFHNLRSASLREDAAAQQHDAVIRSLRTELADKQSSYKLALGLLPVARAQREAAEERLKTVMAQYRSGLKTYLDWEQADSQLNESEQAEITARRQAFTALAELERSLAVPLESQ